MAALSDRYSGPIIELRRVTSVELEPVIREETATWNSALDWDFSPSADLVRRFIDMRGLTGFALMVDARVAGYSYFVYEEGKGLIGDLYVLRQHRTIENENALLEAVLAELWRTPGVRRVEAQLMMLSSPFDRVVPNQTWFRSYPRYFLEADLEGVAKFPPREMRAIAISHWLPRAQEQTARLIATAYKGHIDSQINDQYRSPGGARRFLMNIVQFPGCGTFFGPASFAATSDSSGLLGVSLASMVAPGVGHITQVCVAPSHKGIGLGYELMRRSLAALAAHGCHSVSLTVTTANEEAIRLYRSMGFVNRHDFAAYVWQSR
jgi:ribosomal protein S18 acetylase RimI-like enzyme